MLDICHRKCRRWFRDLEAESFHLQNWPWFGGVSDVDGSTTKRRSKRFHRERSRSDVFAVEIAKNHLSLLLNRVSISPNILFAVCDSNGAENMNTTYKPCCRPYSTRSYALLYVNFALLRDYCDRLRLEWFVANTCWSQKARNFTAAAPFELLSSFCARCLHMICPH